MEFTKSSIKVEFYLEGIILLEFFSVGRDKWVKFEATDLDLRKATHEPR